jgi:N-acetylglucosamine kinase-like BadF-type ATPase
VRKQPAILAVDGGGSKIDAALLRRDGTLLGAARLLSEKYREIGDDDYLAQVVGAVEAASRDAGIEPSSRPVADLGVYCLAGADLPTDDRRIARWLRSARISAADLVGNDTFAVLRAGSDRGWGVAVVCGYGTNCAGVAPDGRVMRFPAVGAISGDWGGGTDLGGAALWHAVRAEDGRGPKTSLRKLAPAYFGMRRPRQLVEAIYFDRLAEERLAELTPLVFEAAGDGDVVAREIVQHQADEIVIMAGTAIRRLRMSSLDPDVVLGGGIFHNHDDSFFRRIREGLGGIAPMAQIEVLTAPPVIGAALIGLDRIGASQPAHRRIRDALTHERLRAQTHGRRKD